eukprot:Skav222802  [mRNA]  locus=scaffold1419:443139:454172:+ [translate_table: standard]
MTIFRMLISDGFRSTSIGCAVRAQPALLDTSGLSADFVGAQAPAMATPFLFTLTLLISPSAASRSEVTLELQPTITQHSARGAVEHCEKAVRATHTAKETIEAGQGWCGIPVKACVLGAPVHCTPYVDRAMLVLVIRDGSIAVAGPTSQLPRFIAMRFCSVLLFVFRAVAEETSCVGEGCLSMLQQQVVATLQSEDRHRLRAGCDG